MLLLGLHGQPQRNASRLPHRSTADFDPALYKRTSRGSWSRVAVSQGATSTENIDYSGTAGTYYGRVYCYSAMGNFVFGMTRP